MSRAELRRDACERLIPGEVSQFSEVELRAAPVLNPALDADACRPPSLWRRLGVYLGTAGPAQTPPTAVNPASGSR
jgi:hypothetical protein